MTLLQLFYRFLKINNIYHLFLYNIQNRKEYNWEINIENINYSKSYMLISSAFRWADTKEDYNFWYNIDFKWKIIIHQYYNKKDMDYCKLKSNTIIKDKSKFINLIKKI